MLRNNSEFIPKGGVFHGSIPLVMGTRLEVVIVGAPKEVSQRLWNWACVEAEALDTVLNRFDPQSELYKVNQASALPGQRPSGLLLRLVRVAKECFERTLGLFDVTKGGMDEVRVDSGSLSLSGHQMDFGGLAKGYFLRELKERLCLLGVGTAFLDFGGSSITAIGRHPYGDCWKVGVRNPFAGGVLSEVELVDRSMSTSGNTPGYSSHIVDPHTGEPVVREKVVTVLCDDPLEAEILSTALMVAGKDEFQRLKGLFPQAETLVFEL